MSRTSKKIQSIVQTLVLLGILIVINILASFVYWDIDLTEDKRFTLSEASYELVENLEEEVTVEIYLEGEFPASFKRLQTAVRELLDKLRSRSSKINYQFINPISGDFKKDRQFAEDLSNKGILPVNLNISSSGEQQQKLVFPGAVVTYKGRQAVVNLLENMGGFNQDYSQMDAIAKSINLLEYKFAQAIQKLQYKSRPRVVLLKGHGELSRPLTTSLEKNLFQHYDIANLYLDSVTQINPLIDVVMVLKPRRAMGDKDLFKLDQYLMNGGNLIWMVDPVNVELDSLRRRGIYAPFEYPLDIFNMLYNYGAKVNPDMILDCEASSVPLQVGSVGGKPQIALKKWMYHPRVFPYTTPYERDQGASGTIRHPIVRNLDYVDTRFPASIDTAGTRNFVKKTPLLRSSRYSNLRRPPVPVSFDIVDANIDCEKFAKKPYRTVAMLLEGNFDSHFRRRVPPEMQAQLEKINQPFKELSEGKGKVLVVSDGDIAANGIDPQQGPMPLGMNPYERYTYGNADFIVNSIEYMLDDDGIIAARNKDIKLRPLDQRRAREERAQWQLINLVLPLTVLVLFALLFTYIRRRRFSRKA